MKTEAIKKTIINNYRILSEKSHVKSNQGDILTIWGLQYKPNNKQEGFVSEVGTIGRKKAKIVIKDNEIKMVKKPFFLTWNETLKNINTMLEGIISNFDNLEIVTKRCVNLLCFPKDFAERIEKINRNLCKR